jgi:Tol biopolymer transport system component
MTRQRIALVVLAVLFVATGTQAGRIAFQSNETGDVEINKTDDDFDPILQWTENEAQSKNHSVSRDGKLVLYDYNDDGLMLQDFVSSDDPVALTNGGGTTSDPCESGDDDFCTNPSAGPEINEDGDFRVIFQRKVPYSGGGYNWEIWMATLDRSVPELIDFVALVDGTSAGDREQQHPEFCGDDPFVWSSFYGGIYDDWEICYQEFDDEGPVGSPTCWEGGDDFDDSHPTCNSGGTQVAWANESETYQGTHDIWIMDTDGTGAFQLTTHSSDETEPAWNPGDTMIVYVSNNGGDYEVWMENADDSGNAAPMTFNSHQDRAPVWAPTVLP